MASDPAQISADPMLAEGLAPPASLSGTRSQSLQRLQIGLFGLGAMILLVALASIIMTNAQQNQARVVPEAAPTVAQKAGNGAASDPLADAGVVPDLPANSRPPEGGNAPRPQP